VTVLTVLDIESTGLDWVAGHRIIEFAAILFDLDTGRRMGQYVQRVNPARPIDPDAQRVHGISFDMLAHEPLWEQVAPNVQRILTSSDYAVAHNGLGFDFPFITHELQRIGVAVPQFTPIDTIDARWATPLGKLPNLRELCFALGVAYDTALAHAALYDCEVLAACYFEARRQGFFPPALTVSQPAQLEAA
jgi:DNA polymerase-3 subunit epsilon